MGTLDKKRLGLADREFSTKSVHKHASDLVDEIADYLESIETVEFDQKVRERIETAHQLNAVSEELASQQIAREHSKYEDAAAEFQRFETAEEASGRFAGVSRDGLEELQSIERKRSQGEQRITELTEAIADHRER